MDDNELGSPRGRGRSRGRGRPRGRPRGPTRGLRVSRRNKIESDDEAEENVVNTMEEQLPTQSPPKPQYDQDCDIFSMETPTFSTLDKKDQHPLIKQLSWDHPVNICGAKVISPRVHMCDICKNPILSYGRMIPCKHVFCWDCAEMEVAVCSCCNERVGKVERAAIGTVFMCQHVINKAVCKRTYLSQRDLQAHIDHRHSKLPPSPTGGGPAHKEDHREERLNPRDPRGRDMKGGYEHESYSGSGAKYGQFTGTTSRTNLITVPIQDTQISPPISNYSPHPHGPPPTHLSGHPPPPHTYPSSMPGLPQPPMYSSTYNTPPYNPPPPYYPQNPQSGLPPQGQYPNPSHQNYQNCPQYDAQYPAPGHWNPQGPPQQGGPLHPLGPPQPGHHHMQGPPQGGPHQPQGIPPQSSYYNKRF